MQIKKNKGTQNCTLDTPSNTGAQNKHWLLINTSYFKENFKEYVLKKTLILTWQGYQYISLKDDSCMSYSIKSFGYSLNILLLSLKGYNQLMHNSHESNNNWYYHESDGQKPD